MQKQSVRDGAVKTCTSCFFDEKFPGITIGADGRCNVCRDNEFAKERKGRRQGTLDDLHAVARELKANRKGKYDCIIGASGGIDSTYEIYVAKKILGLEPLVVNYDSRMTHELANENLRTVCENLGVELRIIRSAKRFDVKYVRSMVKAFRDIDLYWGVCFFCYWALKAAVYRTAVEEGIDMILSAHDRYQTRLHVTRQDKVGALRSRLRRLGPIKLTRLAFYFAVAAYYLLRLRVELYFPPMRNLLRTSPRGPKVWECIVLSRYMPWDIDRIVEELRQVGWRIPKGRIPMRFDCRIEDSLMNHTYLEAFGTTVHAILCNNFIYDGIRERADLEDAVNFHKDYVQEGMRRIRETLGLK